MAQLDSQARQLLLEAQRRDAEMTRRDNRILAVVLGLCLSLVGGAALMVWRWW